ncbi:unnamed protein product [Didymodactylos carnosus]|uniref:Vitellogenin domain-containing protein n=1 Tax=Didymodactylos carnosus TaxID=1234261 RepID=A0A813ZWM8_9BILA|nr:unnamed protein product [Didymodactylos carnosus]CAF3687974.1 unnamed protein product [Didymodactylos carnosus]
MTADVHIKGLGDCKYVVQLRNVQVTESYDKNEESVLIGDNEKEVENTIVRFRWLDGLIVLLETDQSAKVEIINFIKGILSILQVTSPVVADGISIVREEDIHGVCTTRYSFDKQDDNTEINKDKQLSTCAKDKLYLSANPALTTLLEPFVIKCKTVIKNAHHPYDEDNDSFDELLKYDDLMGKNHEEESSKVVYIKQEMTLQSGIVNIDNDTLKNVNLQTLQFVPSATFSRTNEKIETLISKIQRLLNSKDWDQFAASHFLEIANELRRMDRNNLNLFIKNSQLKQLVSTFMNTVYAHDPAASLLNLNQITLKFNNPLAVHYIDNPSTDLVDQMIQGARNLNTNQVEDFVGPAATIVKHYADRRNKDATQKVKDFQRAISKFVIYTGQGDTNVITSILAAYTQLGVYDNHVKECLDDQFPLEIQYHALNVIKNIDIQYMNDNEGTMISRDLIDTLTKKLQNKSNTNAVRIWSFHSLFTSFFYNPNETPDIADKLEQTIVTILKEPLNQVNGFIWSKLKYSSIDRLSPLRGIAARLRQHAPRQQYSQMGTFTSRKIELSLPVGREFIIKIHLQIVFENNRIAPSFISTKIYFYGIKHDTSRIPWIDFAVIIENLDWNLADYFLKLDPLMKNSNPDDKEKTKDNLSDNLKTIQENRDQQDEDPDPSVHLYLKFFGSDLRIRDITDKVQDALRTNLQSFLKNQLMNSMKDLASEKPLFRIPLEIGAAVGTSNGLTLHKSCQIGFLGNLSFNLQDNRDKNNIGKFALTNNGVFSFALTCQREVAISWSTIGETMNFASLSSIPFEYQYQRTKNGRLREFNLINTESILLSSDFDYAVRTSKGLKHLSNPHVTPSDSLCLPTTIYRIIGANICLKLNPFKTINLGNIVFPFHIQIRKDPSIKVWRVAWRINEDDSPQYEIGLEKVGASTYPGLGISAKKTDNNFDIEVLTGMKLFHIKGTQNENKFNGKVYDDKNKEVMDASGTLTTDNDELKMEVKLIDNQSKKEILILIMDLNISKKQQIKADIRLSTVDQKKTFSITFDGDFYKPDSKLFHLSGGFNLPDISYEGKFHIQNNTNFTRIELKRTIKFKKTDGSVSGYDFVYNRRKPKQDKIQREHDIQSHLSWRLPQNEHPVKVYDLNCNIKRTLDNQNFTINSALEFTLLTRQPLITEQIEFDYVRRLSSSQNQHLVSPQADLKVKLKTKSKTLGFVIDHHHKIDKQSGNNDNSIQLPKLEVHNKIHVEIDTNKLFPHTLCPIDLNVLSHFNCQFFNEPTLNYTFKYVNKQTQRDAELVYKVNEVTMGDIFIGTSSTNLNWNSKKDQITTQDTFLLCTNPKLFITHSDINTTWDKDSLQLDFEVYPNRSPQQHKIVTRRRKSTSKSNGADFNLTLTTKRTSGFQYLDINGIFYLSQKNIDIKKFIAWKVNNTLKEIDLNVDINFDPSRRLFESHTELLLPIERIPLISNNIQIEQNSQGQLNRFTSKTNAQPLFSHDLTIGVMRETNKSPYVMADNIVIYQHNDDDYVQHFDFAFQRWTTVRSCGKLRQNDDLLFSHDIGYEFSKKTKRIALSLESPMLTKSNGLTAIGELTIDKQTRVGKLNLPKEFGVHFELGTPLTNKAALKFKYDLLGALRSNTSVDGKISFELSLQRGRSFSFDWESSGSWSKALNILSSVNIGDNTSVTALISAQYSPFDTSQLVTKINGRYFGQIFEKSLNILVKQHEISVKGEFKMPNNTNRSFFRYNIGTTYNDNKLIAHIERTDIQQTIVANITTKTCAGERKDSRKCYSGDVVVKSTIDQQGKIGTFDINWIKSSLKWNMNVPDLITMKFDHSHTGKWRADDFTFKTIIDVNMLRADDRKHFHYIGSAIKDDGTWNMISHKTHVSDKNTTEKLINFKFDFKSDIIDKRAGDEQTTLNFDLERNGTKLIDWSSRSISCSSRDPAKVIYGICQMTTFDLKANSQLIRDIRKRLMFPDDPKIDSVIIVNYDGTVKLDLKHDKDLGPHTLILDLNRLKEDTIDFNLSVQPQTDSQPLAIKIIGKVLDNDPISIKYDQISKTNIFYNSTLKYSFNTNDKNAEKSYICTVEKPDDKVLNINCIGERTKLTIDHDQLKRILNVYIDLNKYEDERVGFKFMINPKTNQIDMTLYTFVNTWLLQQQSEKLTTITVKQKGKEVYRVEGTRVNNEEIQVKFLPKNINLKLTWNNLTTILLHQTQPQQHNLLSISFDRKTLKHYLPNLHNRNIPNLDIDQQSQTKIFNRSLIEVIVEPVTIVRLSQATEKFGAHHGKGLDTIKKRFNLEFGNQLLTLYNSQHWKTHYDDVSFPESYTIQLYSNKNNNFIQLSTKKWAETRFINEIGHSINGSKTLTTDLSLVQDYAHKVGALYFFHSNSSRNVITAKELHNQIRSYFIEEFKDVRTSNLVQLTSDIRKSLCDIIQVDYAAVKQIVQDWNEESEKSVLRRLSESVGLIEFFKKYSTYKEFSDNIVKAIRERYQECHEGLKQMIHSLGIIQRVYNLSTRLNQERNKLVERLSTHLEGVLNRTMPMVDEVKVDQRIEQIVQNLLQGFQDVIQRSNDQWKTIFKQIDEATKDEDMKWFRQLIIDIDSTNISTAMDFESNEMFKRLNDSSKLFTSNILKLFRRMRDRREQLRNLLRNAARYVPKLMINETHFEVSVPYGIRPGTYNSLPISIASVLSLVSNRKRMNDTVPAVIFEFFQSQSETFLSYKKFIKSIAKRLSQRNPSLTPERVAIITATGHGIDLHGHYIYLNPVCDYVLLHDFTDLQFSFRYTNGKVYTVIPAQAEIPDHECSKTDRVQACCENDYCSINVPIYYGGRADGVLGDIRDRSDTKPNITQWLDTNCDGREEIQKSSKKPKGEASPVSECDNANDVCY